jgi:hypothetical protein
MSTAALQMLRSFCTGVIWNADQLKLPVIPAKLVPAKAGTSFAGMTAASSARFSQMKPLPIGAVWLPGVGRDGIMALL